MVEYVDHIQLTSHEAANGNHFEQNFSQAIQDIDSELLLKMIHALPPAFRITFNLHEIEGYSHTEIASKLQITESAVRSYLVKARQKLQQMLQTIQKH